MIRDFKPRLYQETILATAATKNTLVVLPTGMGKTSVALLLAAQRLKQYPKSKILLLAPTRPLVQQLMDVFKRHLEIGEEKIVMFTGFTAPDKRKELWKDATIISSTPQGLENDILSSRISLKDVSLLVFDEAHRAVKDYSYVWIAKQYVKTAQYPRILGLTASPGSDVERITEVCQNLSIEEVEIRSERDPDMKPYIQEIKFDFVHVTLPESFKEIKKFLETCFKSKLEQVKEKGFISSIQLRYMTKKELLGVQAELHSQLARGAKDFEMMKAVSFLAEAMKVQHALELLETQGITALYKYFEKLTSQASTTKVKAVKNLVKDLNFRSAMIKTERLLEKGIEHPKLNKLKEILEKEMKPGIKIMIFNQYRDNALMILSEIKKIKGIEPRLFVGQAKKGETGMSQKEQLRILGEFGEGRFNTLIATSIGEEGLDIPRVDLVIFYEPIPSAIRHIQRRGRTGRLEKGHVTILMTKYTRDEAYRWTAYHKEKRMHYILDDLKRKVDSVLRQRPKESLKQFIDTESIKMFADAREKGSSLIKGLVELGADISITKLESADYILSNRVAVEHKTVPDFVDSIIDGRLLQQLKTLKQSFERPLVVVEGLEDIYSIRKVHPNAILGMLATIAISFGVPILQTKNPKETASLLHIIARREQDELGKDFTAHGAKPVTLKEQQEYIVSAFPGIGGTISKPLLRRFRSIRGIVNADADKLKEVELIGEKKAKSLRELFDAEYEV